jgi:hypothetical protein
MGAVKSSPTRMLPYLFSDIDAAVEQACRELKIDLIHVGSLQAWIAEPESEWPTCCDRGCEPCVLTLGAAARRARSILEQGHGIGVSSPSE